MSKFPARVLRSRHELQQHGARRQTADAGRPGRGGFPALPGTRLRADHGGRHRRPGRGRPTFLLPVLPLQGGRGLPRPRALPGRHDRLPRRERPGARAGAPNVRRGPAGAPDVRGEPGLLRAALPAHPEGAGPAGVRAVGGLALRARAGPVSARPVRRAPGRDAAGRCDRGRGGRRAQQRAALLAAVGRTGRRGCRRGPRPGTRAAEVRAPAGGRSHPAVRAGHPAERRAGRLPGRRRAGPRHPPRRAAVAGGAGAGGGAGPRLTAARTDPGSPVRDTECLYE
ncbi:hypothetical protein SGPA1_40571 [Streptomyces misionensis JCM 4497]